MLNYMDTGNRDGQGGESPVLIGERVRYEGRAGMAGVVTEALEQGYLRVLWDGSVVPTTHRRYCLERE